MSLFRRKARPSLDELLDLGTERPEDRFTLRLPTLRELAEQAADGSPTPECPICGERHTPPPQFLKELFDSIDREDEPAAEHRYTAVLSVTRDDGKAVVDITATGPYGLVRYVVESALSEGADHLG